MSDEKTIVTTEEGDRRLGEHLIKWAIAGRERREGETVDDGWPRSLEEFMNDVDAVFMNDDGSPTGADIEVPKRLKAIQFTQSNMETLLIRLPPRTLVKQSKENAESGNGDPYLVPSWYEEAATNPPADPDGRVRLFQLRVGDYTITHCK